ncbi:FUSC family protein [Novosphingobium profundi]|uniref:FUSC family protein n=1 Tax=Novosphingobium profundi TaxID=1774954 RepID=UPI001CFE6453|nr:FUSC family protein [Novosphingobium profundi]
MTRLPDNAPQSRPPSARAGGALRALARRLELRSYGLVPEHFSAAEGCRAALAVALPLALAVALEEKILSWAVFAAFWTCLCDPNGPDRLHRRTLGAFALCGTLVTFAGALLAHALPGLPVLTGPALVFAIILVSPFLAREGLFATLLGVVAVVAVGFPQGPALALVQALAFLAGATWAWLLINGIWRRDARKPLERAHLSVLLRLQDMAGELANLGDGQAHRDAQWHSEHGQHRRAVRLAIERLRGLLDQFAPHDDIARQQRALEAGEQLFAALIALDQAFIDGREPAAERERTARACRTALRAWQVAYRRASAGRVEAAQAVLEWTARRLGRHRAGSTSALLRGCLRAFEQALALPLTAPVRGEAAQGTPSSRSVPLRRALRLTAALVLVYLVARGFDLGYPYWAALAVIVVLQGGSRVTWTRALERIAGTALGGGAAMGVVYLNGGDALSLSLLATLLAAIAIALRAVNYTLFVLFLTMLFVIVTEMLQPGSGIAWARILDNIVGSLAALLAVLALWPDLGVPLEERLRAGIAANRAYLDAVEGDAHEAEIEMRRRAAGLASVEAELARHELGNLVRRASGHEDLGEAQLELRTIAGRAAMARLIQLGTKGPDA